MRVGAARRVAILLALLLCMQCGGGSTTTPSPGPDPTQPPGPNPNPNPNPQPIPSAPQVFAGAGDIAQCGALDPAHATARLMELVGGTVFALGDNAYFSGTADEYRNCYDPTWGRFKSFTRPVPGNHEYETPGAGPYFSYFGANAGPPGLGYYSFELGENWHAVALNSNIDSRDGSAQGAWLKADLDAFRNKKCTIAYWHHPLFSSGQNGPSAGTRDFWRILFNAGAEIVLNGHDHLYERFAPQDPDGLSNPSRGIRQFTVGTGGASLYEFVSRANNSEVRIKQFGVLKLTLNADSYDWQFTPVAGPGDSGHGICH
jgi:calcineurin-like phosphoesterase family protein